MSSRMCDRLQCFLAEYVLAHEAELLTEEWEPSARFQHDLDLLSPKERSVFLKRLETDSSLGTPILFAKLRSYKY